jgi:hypothetical protein
VAVNPDRDPLNGTHRLTLNWRELKLPANLIETF